MAHIRHTHEKHKNYAWCRARLSLMDWAFVDLDHAAYTRMNEGITHVCGNCVKAARAALAGNKIWPTGDKL